MLIVEILKEEHINKMMSFATGYAEALQDIQDKQLDIITDDWDGLVFCFLFIVALRDVVEIESIPYEDTNVLELVDTLNTPVKKIMLVFTSLCDEMELMYNEVYW